MKLAEKIVNRITDKVNDYIEEKVEKEVEKRVNEKLEDNFEEAFLDHIEGELEETLESDDRGQVPRQKALPASDKDEGKSVGYKELLEEVDEDREWRERPDESEEEENEKTEEVEETEEGENEEVITDPNSIQLEELKDFTDKRKEVIAFCQKYKEEFHESPVLYGPGEERVDKYCNCSKNTVTSAIRQAKDKHILSRVGKDGEKKEIIFHKELEDPDRYLSDKSRSFFNSGGNGNITNRTSRRVGDSDRGSLSNKAQRIVSYIREYKSTNGESPNHPQICSNLDISPTEYNEAIHNLKKDGWIEKDRDNNWKILKEVEESDSR